MVQRFVPIVQILQLDVLFDGRLGPTQMHQESVNLLVNVVNFSREQSANPEPVPLLGFERRALVEKRILQYVPPSRADRNGGHEIPPATCPLSLGVQSFDGVPGRHVVVVVVLR